jgi:hypothetical protein
MIDAATGTNQGEKPHSAIRTNTTPTICDMEGTFIARTLSLLSFDTVEVPEGTTENKVLKDD